MVFTAQALQALNDVATAANRSGLILPRPVEDRLVAQTEECLDRTSNAPPCAPSGLRSVNVVDSAPLPTASRREQPANYERAETTSPAVADITIESDGDMLDSAAWDDWVRCVGEVKARPGD